jgi:phosphoenolpyruvate carboxykinase (ATP)
MRNAGIRPSRNGLDTHGLHDWQVAYWNLGTSQLIEKALQQREGILASGGALVVRTGRFTGRSPQDKYIVQDELTSKHVHWGSVNQPMSEEAFDTLYNHMLKFWKGQDIFVQDCWAGADPIYRMPIRIVTQRAWHNLFARQLFIRPDWTKTDEHKPEFTVIFAPAFFADPERDGTNSKTCIALNFKRRVVMIIGTQYAGEMKKAIFSVLNYLLPFRDVLPMHCSANVGDNGRVALFFGLSGTGKTTLSADPNRRLIGDDEHGWSDHGVFNFEGGCYAKCIHLSKEKEPQIWNAIRYGAVLENVVVETELRLLDFDSDEITENTRAAYPLRFVDNAVIPSYGGHPSHVIFLTADAFGVLPPISRLTPEQAMYHFLSGYTAKVAGTERGMGKEPTATFSACFGAPFLPLPPQTYARMLGERMRRHEVVCYLVNTGWVGGPYGVGERMNLPATRAMVNAAVGGKLDSVPVKPDPVFQILVPESVPGVAPSLLDARSQWPDPLAYDRAAQDLSARFRKNFEKFGLVADEILEAAPAAG